MTTAYEYDLMPLRAQVPNLSDDPDGEIDEALELDEEEEEDEDLGEVLGEEEAV